MKYLIYILSFAFIISCNKDPDPEIDDSVPACIQAQIDTFKANSDPCSQRGPSVIEYKFQDETVYAFDMGQCISDGSTMILNATCENICTLGTIIGITECRGEQFSNAVEVRVLWQE
ncbi:DUF6970 domain-containing protein [Portibacter lacus]|uniref:DUF6970 domain-containing protein n=1 Tax=Portibacter lacus TaxID=1099794 RepID=A0AA37SKG2_9BACT|nr:hypothetical protein [Portibacter lacus]GLR15557.1 hypothetical protein GCM10007940_01720 [Portibacter lacus]